MNMITRLIDFYHDCDPDRLVIVACLIATICYAIIAWTQS